LKNRNEGAETTDSETHYLSSLEHSGGTVQCKNPGTMFMPQAVVKALTYLPLELHP